MDEATLIAGLRQREEKAFRYLLDTYQQQLYGLCMGYVHHRQEAEDLVQEVFVQVVRSIGRFRGEASLSTWLYRIAVNKSLNHLRARKNRLSLALDNLFEDQEADLHTPLHSLQDNERTRVLQEAIDRLPENQRTAFILSKYRELPHKQIAAVMELSLPAVEALLHRAKKNLQKYLIGYYRTGR